MTTTLPADATLTRLIRESLTAVPELAGAESVARAQTERVPRAGALPDPMFQVGIQNDGFTSIEIGRMPTSFVSLMLSQTFPWPGKLGIGKEVARLDSSLAREGVARVRLSVEADVRRAYLDLLLVRDRLTLLDQLEGLWQQSLVVARIRYENSGGAQSDVLRAQLELNRITQRRLALHAEELTRVEALNRLRNHRPEEPIETTTHVRDLPAPALLEQRFAVERTVARSPEVAAARIGVTRARESVALAEKSYYPDLTVGAGVMIRGALPPMWLATVGGPLPVFAGSKQSRAVAENRALASASRSEVTALEQVLRLRSRERHAVFRALLQIIEVYTQGLLIQSQATTESTLSQYRVGKVSFASVLDANAGFIADQVSYLEAIAAAHRVLIAESELSLAPVVMPPEAGGSGAMSGASSGTPSGASPSSAGAPGGGSTSM